MVIKTEVCYFSEMKIYPGHGTQFVRKDGRLLNFLNGKVESMFHQGIKPARLTWTQSWRRMNKKVKVDQVSKRRTKRRVKLQKAVGGISLDDLKKKQSVKPAVRKAQREAKIREIKEKKAATKKAAKAQRPKQHQQHGKMKFSQKGRR